jgi:hypothetical protein
MIADEKGKLNHNSICYHICSSSYLAVCCAFTLGFTLEDMIAAQLWIRSGGAAIRMALSEAGKINCSYLPEVAQTSLYVWLIYCINCSLCLMMFSMVWNANKCIVTVTLPVYGIDVQIPCKSTTRLIPLADGAWPVVRSFLITVPNNLEILPWRYPLKLENPASWFHPITRYYFSIFMYTMTHVYHTNSCTTVLIVALLLYQPDAY